MNRKDLILAIAEKTRTTNTRAGQMLEATLSAITKSLKKGDSVTLVGFGTFKVAKRAARTGVNPRTGAKIKIPGAKVPRFVAGAALKTVVNGKKA